MHAAVDVGTNTVRLLIGAVANGQVIPAHYGRRITRLGGGVTEAGLAPEAMARTLEAMRDFADDIARTGIVQVRAVGTEILRTAKNAPDFVRQVIETTGLPLEIVDGEKEARLTAAGVLSALEPRPADCLIVDIGGGSTEFILCHAGEALLHRSYPLGVVRLAEDFADDASRNIRIEGILAEFRAELEEKNLLPLVVAPACRLVGTAGTVTTLAALHLRMRSYDWQRINNLTLDSRDIKDLHQLLDALSIPEREALPGMEKGRGDLIVPGVNILLAIIDMFSRESLTVSDFGLLEGVLLETT